MSLPRRVTKAGGGARWQAANGRSYESWAEALQNSPGADPYMPMPADDSASQRQQRLEYWADVGRTLGLTAAGITFMASWIYCAVVYGFLFGFGLGWLPSGILAAIVGVATRHLWPPILILILIGGLSFCASL